MLNSSIPFTSSELSCVSFPSKIKFLSNEQGRRCVGGTFELKKPLGSSRFLAWRFWGSELELLDVELKRNNNHRVTPGHYQFRHDFRSLIIPSPACYESQGYLHLFIMTTGNTLHRLTFTCLPEQSLFSIPPRLQTTTFTMPRGVNVLQVNSISEGSVAVHCGNTSIYSINMDGQQVELNDNTFVGKYLPGFLSGPAVAYRTLALTTGPQELIFSITSDGMLRIFSSSKFLTAHNLYEDSTHTVKLALLKHSLTNDSNEIELVVYLSCSAHQRLVFILMSEQYILSINPSHRRCLYTYLSYIYLISICSLCSPCMFYLGKSKF